MPELKRVALIEIVEDDAGRFGVQCMSGHGELICVATPEWNTVGAVLTYTAEQVNLHRRARAALAEVP